MSATTAIGRVLPGLQPIAVTGGITGGPAARGYASAAAVNTPPHVEPARTIGAKVQRRFSPPVTKLPFVKPGHALSKLRAKEQAKLRKIKQG